MSKIPNAKVILSQALTVAGDRSPAGRQFMQLPEFAVWRALTAGELGLWLAILPHAIAWRHEMHNRCQLVPRFPTPEELGVALMVVALVVIPLITTRSDIKSPLPYNSVRMGILYGLGLLIGMVVVLGLTGVYTGLASRHWDEADETREGRAKYPPQHYLEDLRILGSFKRRYLAAAGAMISVAVLSTAALQNAVNAFHRLSTPAGKASVAAASPGLLLAFGGLFVAVLALIYLPCHVYIHRRGEA